jgi:hypothetical protein
MMTETAMMAAAIRVALIAITTVTQGNASALLRCAAVVSNVEAVSMLCHVLLNDSQLQI